MLTGWLAGPNAYHLKNVTKEQILEKAISSLAYIFGEEKKSIEQKLISSHLGNSTGFCSIVHIGRKTYCLNLLNTVYFLPVKHCTMEQKPVLLKEHWLAELKWPEISLQHSMK